jgi:(S)-2-hydroxyglutarate dehydrogenase
MRADVLIVGGGIIGLSIARALVMRAPSPRVVVIDKEASLGAHASSRNSGVLHAGFYYSASSLKARLCRDGNARLRAWCYAHNVAVRPTGKLVVARSESEHGALDELLERANQNGVELHGIDEAEARRIEPRVRTHGRALWSPTTAAVQPAEVVEAMARELEQRGVTLRRGCAFQRVEGAGRYRTSDGVFEAGFVVNAAGLQADRVAAQFDVAGRYQIVPYRGLYLTMRPQGPPLACAIYPVPDLGMPFLGVHFTVRGDGAITIGPTALPALWREQYGGLSGFALDELCAVAIAQTKLFLQDPSMRRLALREAPKVLRHRLVARAASLLHGVHGADFPDWGRPGIRAQLLDRQQGSLLMDFVIEEGESSVHVLNAVSPGFTCSLPFGEMVAERVP